MKQNFRGWTTVYGFTFRQSTRGVGFKVVTTLITLLIIGAIVIANIIIAKPEENTTPDISPVKTVFISDNSGLAPTAYQALTPEFSTDQFKHINFNQVSGKTREEVIDTAAKDSDKSFAVMITTTKAGYQMEAVIPSKSSLSQHQVQTVLDLMSSSFQTNKIMQSGLTEAQIKKVFMPEVTNYSTIGDNTNMITFVIKLAAPMVFSFMLYFMLLMHGQTISKSVSNEKTSKLMETLLTSVHPYALITGKVLAITSMALLQFILWIAAAIVGLYGGNAIAQSMYPDFNNSAIAVINFLRDNIGETAMTPAALILAIIFFCVGFLFYCVIAGLAGCMVSKPEDAASTQTLFVFPTVISWLVVYFGAIANNQQLMQVVRYIPFTAPFSVPVDLITGAVSPMYGILQLGILLLCTLIFIMLSGRIYKGLILYNGQKLSLKMIGNVIKASK